MTLGADSFSWRSSCCACGSVHWRTLSVKTRFVNSYDFPIGAVQVGQDACQRELRCCLTCGIWYFSVVPHSEAVRAMTDRPGVTERWHSDNERPAFLRAVDRIAPMTPGAILDIGSHSGGFLAMLPESWTKVALEPMAEAVTSPAEEVLCGFLESTDIGKERFDVITAFDVFEHFEDPARATFRIASALRPGGLLLLETGTKDSRLARILRSAWYYLQYLEHLQAFDSASIRTLLEEHGLEVVEELRVHQSHVRWWVNFRSAFSAVAFIVLTGGGREPRVWRHLNRLLRPSSPGLPPSTVGLERDHIFVVARRRVSS